MNKVFKLILKNNSIILFSPDLLKIKEKSNYLKEKLSKLKDVENLMNKSKLIILKMDLLDYNFYFSDEKIDEYLLNDYDCYLKRSIIVKNNKLVLKDTKDLECYENNNIYEINLDNGYYIVHIFSKDDNIYFYFEKSKNKKIRVTFSNRFEIITDKKTKRLNLSSDFNNYMLNNYFIVLEEEIKEKFSENENNFIFNMGKLKVTSGHLTIVDASNYNEVNNVISKNEYLNRNIPVGEYPIYLSMRKSNYFGTYISGIKIEISKNKVEDFELVKTNLGKDIFSVNSFYSAISDIEALKDYNSIRQSLNYLSEDKNLLTIDFDKNKEKYKDIIDIHNQFLMWNIPSKTSNIALINIELNIYNYSAYYGLDKDNNVSYIYIPLINNNVFKYKELSLSENEDLFIDSKINEIRDLLNSYIEYLKEKDEYYPDLITNIPPRVQEKIENVIFEIRDLNLEKSFIYKLIEFFDEYPNIGFYIKSDSVFDLIKERYNKKEIIENIIKKPTSFKIYLLAKYLYQNNYKDKENKELFKLLKSLRKDKDYFIRSAAKQRYKEITEDEKKKRKKIFIIVLLVIVLSMIIDAFFPRFHYNTIIDNENYKILSNNINSKDNKYRVYYNLMGNDYDHFKMEKNEVWFSDEDEDYLKTKRIKMKIFDENIEEYKKGLIENRNLICSSDTEYSHIECSDIIEDENYKIGNMTYYYFSFSFVENDSFHSQEEYLLYKIDDNNFLCIYNDVYDITEKEFLKLTSNVISAIKVRK